MGPLASIPEFQAAVHADLDALRTRVHQALGRLETQPSSALALGELQAALHSLRGLAGAANLPVLAAASELLERLAEVGGSLVPGDPERARAVFRAFHGPNEELTTLFRHPSRGETALGQEALERLRDALRPDWGEYLELTPSERPAAAGPGPGPGPEPAADSAEAATAPGPNPAAPAAPAADALPSPAPAETTPPLLLLGPGEPATPPHPPLEEAAPLVPAPAGAARSPGDDDAVLAFLLEIGVGGPAAASPPLPSSPPPAAAETDDEEETVDPEMLQYFVPETEEYCEQIDQALGAWDETGRDDNPRLTLLRLFHTIKGAANSIGLRDLGHLAHQLEDVFDRPDSLVPASRRGPRRQLVGRAVDLIKEFTRQAGSGKTALPPGAEGLRAQLDGWLRERAALPATLPVAPPPDPDPAPAPAPDEGRDLILPPTASAPDREGATLPTLPGAAEPGPALAPVPRAAPAVAGGPGGGGGGQEAAAGPVPATAAPPADPAPALDPVPDPIRALPPAAAAPAAPRTAVPGGSDAFENPSARIDAETLDQLMNLIGELSVSRSRLLAKVESFSHLQRELELGKGRLLRLVGEFQDKHEYSSLGGGTSQRLDGFGELEFDQYDELNILARSLVEIGADTGEIIDQSRRFFDGFTADTDRFSKINGQLQDALTRVRMVPLVGMFRRLRRVANDAAEQEGKEIEFHLEGTDTRLDKVIADQIFSPLLHIVRNAVSHGIETPARRLARGKPRAGRLTLRASQRANQAVIEVEEDGQGLDYAAIRQRALVRGLISAEEAAQWDEARLTNLIFQAGFTTRTEVSAVSGRGIGLDAVLRQVSRLNGTIEVSSRPGQGCTLTLRLPLTMMIGQAMFVRAGGQSFALPLNFVDRVVTWSPADVSQDRAGQEWLAVDAVLHAPGRHPGDAGPLHLPFLRLPELLGYVPAPTPAKNWLPGRTGEPPQLAVITRLADKSLVLSIDALVRRAETVTKPLGPLLGHHPLFSGATVDLDGRIVLILDVPRIAQYHFARQGDIAVLKVAAAEAVAAEAVAAEAAEVRTASVPRAGASADAVDAGPRAPRMTRRLPVPGQPAAPRAAGPKPLVLIVDDSLSIRKVAEKYAQSLGCDVETAADGQAALEKLARHRFSLVLTDLEMPRMHGFELIAEIRQDAAWKHLPIIVVTSRQADKHRQQAIEVGANDYLVKPFTRDQLSAKIQVFLQAGGAPPPTPSPSPDAPARGRGPGQAVPEPAPALVG